MIRNLQHAALLLYTAAAEYKYVERRHKEAEGGKILKERLQEFGVSVDQQGMITMPNGEQESVDDLYEQWFDEYAADSSGQHELLEHQEAKLLRIINETAEFITDIQEVELLNDKKQFALLKRIEKEFSPFGKMGDINEISSEVSEATSELVLAAYTKKFNVELLLPRESQQEPQGPRLPRK